MDLLIDGEGVKLRLSLGGMYEYCGLSETDAEGVPEGERDADTDADADPELLGDPVILTLTDGERELEGESLIVGDGEFDVLVDGVTDDDDVIDGVMDVDGLADADVEIVTVLETDADVVAELLADTDAVVEGVVVGVGEGYGAHSWPLAAVSSQMLKPS